MKHLTSYLLSWLFYGIGYALYKLSYGFGILEQKVMMLSSDIQDWGGAGAWQKED